jgi:hypothetical protein
LPTVLMRNLSGRTSSASRIIMVRLLSERSQIMPIKKAVVG